ncbi:MAG: ArsA family ATPase, partial [Acidimicrobiales bacterium]
REALAFFTAFEGMEQGFRDRTDRVETLLRAGTTRFVLVAAPRAAATAEAGYFARRLAEAGLTVAAVVENRVFPDYGPAPAVSPPKVAALDGSSGLRALLANAEDLHRVVTSEATHIRDLAAATPDAGLVRVPFLAEEVHDLDGLLLVAAHLFPA